MHTPKGVIVFITNDLQSPAKRICDLYKVRWEIEVFFKWIKQNLKIKRFLGRNQNAIEIQLWVALIVYLILHMIKRNFKFNGSILKLIRLINLKLLCHVGMADMLSPPKLVGYEDWKVGSLFDSSGQ
jgi:putative transposase